MSKLALFSLLSVLFLFSCTGKSLVIGVIGPMESQNAKLLFQSVSLAAEEINAQGGIGGREISLIPIDDANKADQAVQNLNAALDQHKIDILLGGMSSGVVLQLMEVMAERKIIWLGTGGAHPDVITKIKDNYEKYKYYFRVGTTDAREQAKAIAQFADEVLKTRYGFTRFAVIGTDLIWARMGMQQSRDILLEKGFTSTYEKYFHPQTLDFKNHFSNAQKSGAQFAISYTLGDEGTTFIKQYHDSKMPLPVIGNHSVGTRDEWWAETEGKCVWDLHFRFSGGKVALTEKTLVFAEKFRQTFNASPGFLSWPGYDALFILREAVDENKTLETQGLIKALEKIEYVGNVRYKFDPYHDLTYGTQNGKRYVIPVFFQWKPGGRIVCVWPEDLAEEKYELPDWIKNTKY